MREGGLLDDAAVLRLNAILEEGSKQETLLTAKKGDIGGDLLDIPITKTDVAMTALQRLVGLRVGRFATANIPGTGQGLAEPTIFANLTDRILSSVPNSMANDMIVEAALNPNFFKILMEKARPRKRQVVLNNQLRGFLINSGFIAADDTLFDDGEQDRQSRNIRALRNLRANNPAVPPAEAVQQKIDKVSSVAPQPVPAQPVAPPPTTTLASAAPPPPPPAASGPVNRQRYAALFPNDPTSALIRQQGIGSLMG